jgi:hypothetical protein
MNWNICSETFDKVVLNIVRVYHNVNLEGIYDSSFIDKEIFDNYNESLIDKFESEIHMDKVE